MKRDAHYAVTLLLTTPFLLLGPLPEMTLFLILGVTFTESPNWERSFGLVSRRGIMHTIWFTIFIGGFVFVCIYGLLKGVEIGFKEIAWFVPSIIQPTKLGTIAGVAASFGTISHLLGDAITVGAGKPALQPFSPLSRNEISYQILKERSQIAWHLLHIAIILIGIVYMYRLGFAIGYMQS